MGSSSIYLRIYVRSFSALACASFLTVFATSGTAGASGSEGRTYDCSDEYWVDPPTLEDGHFRSKLGIKCKFEKRPQKDLFALRDSLDEYLRSKRVVRRADKKQGADGSTTWEYDTVLTLTEKDDPVRIHEVVTLATDGKANFGYKTQSKEVDASGMASYLKHVEFALELKRESPAGAQFEVDMTNEIQVDRPWYALAPLFFVMTKGVAKDKFECARDTILQAILERF